MSAKVVPCAWCCENPKRNSNAGSSKKKTDRRKSYVMTTFDRAHRDLVDKSLKKVSKPGRLETEAHLALV
jgi:hypothetical protein